MTTPKQQAANRHNAKRSTGPRSKPGKSVASRNATTHGILSGLTVLESESQSEWTRHLTSVIADLQPMGHLETVLAERVALHLWRLVRVARFEVAEIEAPTFSSVGDGPPRMPRGGSSHAVIRYETHVERALGRSLQELRHLEASRVTLDAI